jgi:hypothetical protein
LQNSNLEWQIDFWEEGVTVRSIAFYAMAERHGGEKSFKGVSPMESEPKPRVNFSRRGASEELTGETSEGA